jgi:hypothetical protein
MKKLSLAISASMVSALVLAQQYSIDWHKIASGGGTGTGGNFTLSGTIGQHDASAPAGGGNFSLTGGFWAMSLAVQTPGAPALFIAHAGNSVTIFWQDTPGWGLQQNGNPASPAGWSASGGSSLVDGTNYLTFINPAGNHFFRLYHP